MGISRMSRAIRLATPGTRGLWQMADAELGHLVDLAVERQRGRARCAEDQRAGADHAPARGNFGSGRFRAGA